MFRFRASGLTTRCMALVLALLGSGIARSARAADTSHVDADARFDEGTALAKKGQFEAARAKFLQSYALYKSPRTLLNLSIVEKNTGRQAEALRHLRMYLKDPTSDPDKVAELQKGYFKELYAATGHFRFTGDAVAIVAVDDQPLTNLSEEWDEAPGVHRVAVQRADRKEVREYRLSAGQVVEVDLRGVSAPSSVATPPITAVEIAPPPGPSDAYWNARRYAGLGILGAGVVVAVGGFILFHSAASSDVGDLNLLKAGENASTRCFGQSTPECVQRAALEESRRQNTDFRNAALIGGLALAAIGWTVFILPNPTSASQAKVRVTPSGVALSGSF